MGSVIDYIPGSSLLHRLNPVTKLALAAAIILATFLADTYGLLIALLALTFALGAYARATSGLVSLAKLMVPLSVIMLVLQTAFIMLTVTKLNDLANAVVEVLHVPYRYAFTFTTALRFVPVFSQEMNAIMEAQTARGVEYDTKNPLKKLQLMLPLCIPLLVSSVGKTDATALAAEQRGFYLRTRESSYKRYPMAGADFAVLACCVALIALGVLF